MTLFVGFRTLGYLPALHELSLWLSFRFKMPISSKVAPRYFLQMCDVTELELFTDQAEFNVVLERWFGELALEEDVRSENEGPRGLVLKGRLSTIFGSDLPVVNKANINTM